MTMNIDMQRLHADRRALAARTRSLKQILRSTWTRPLAAEQRELHQLKLAATELCILRAWLRGKLHLPDAERCREVAERRMTDYRVEAA